MSRRRWIAALVVTVETACIAGAATVPAPLPARAVDASFAVVEPTRPVRLPADHGAHPGFRTEWWYSTGWLGTPAGETLGFQVTFFRTRPRLVGDNPSAFTPRELVIAHAALSDPRRGRLWKDQRLARAALGLAGTDTRDTRAWLDRWTFERRGDRYVAQVDAGDFALDLELRVTQPPMLNGRDGYSQKGPLPESASYYYSQPQLEVTGRVRRESRSDVVRGRGWLDHEWSSAYLDRAATGWDWLGINLDDGGALMLFRIRDHRGQRHWAGGTLRDAAGRVRTFEPGEVQFTPGRVWRSPRTGIAYPVTWRVRAGTLDLQIVPLMDDQESDTRASTGAIYWEGAVTASAAGRAFGRGYLELTGYGERLRLP